MSQFDYDYDDDFGNDDSDDEDRDFGNDLLDDDDRDLIDGVGFADPGGRSALRRETASNPRIHPCPTCHEPNMLTVIDKQRGYQCDSCADRVERGW